MTNTRALATGFDQADNSPGLLLWRVTQTWQASQRAALAPHNLTHVQFVLLASLAWLNTDHPVSQADLAYHAGTDPMMTSQVLRALERKGLVGRTAHPTDRRAFSISATPAGIESANAAVIDVESVDRRFFGTLGATVPDFSRQLAALLSARHPGT